MQPLIVPCGSEEMWHAERSKFLGASEIPSLFGKGYLSKLQLWNLKKGKAEPEPPSERMWLGIDLEEGNARNYARMHGRKVVTPQEYFGQPKAYAVILRHPTLPVQCTPDRVIIEPRSARLLQLKSYGRWAIDEWDSTGEPPLGVQIQVQAELLASGFELGAIGCIANNERRDADVERHASFQDTLAREIRAFWLLLQGEAAPPPSAEDLSSVRSAFPHSVEGLSFDYQATEDFLELARLKAELARLEERHDALLAKIQLTVGPAETITSAGRKVANWKTSIRNDPPREARSYPVRSFRLSPDLLKAAKAALPAHEQQRTPILDF